MKKLHKKGMDYAFVFSIGFIILFFYLSNQLDVLKGKTGEIGITQISIKKAQHNSEEVLFFIDQAAKYSIFDSIYSLAENGGFDESKCGKYKDFNLWNLSNPDCCPNAEFNLGKYLQNNLNSYIEKGRNILKDNYCKYSIPRVENIQLPKDNYDFLIEKGEDNFNITGIPTMNLVLEICAEIPKLTLFYFPFYGTEEIPLRTEPIGKFFIKPSFFREVDYNLGDYNKIKEVIENIIKKCSDKQDLLYSTTHDLQRCINAEKDSNWNLIEKGVYPTKGQEEDRNFAFEAASNKKMPFHDNNIIYKFAIFVPDEAAPPAIDGVEVSKKEGENKVILKWKESKALDVKNYIVYSVSSEEKYNIKCEEMFDYFKTSLPIYKTAKKQIELSGLPESEGTLSYELEIEENKTYCFAITAIDEVPNEISQNDEKISKIKYPADKKQKTEIEAVT